jgi:hypothetical protein
LQALMHRGCTSIGMHTRHASIGQCIRMPKHRQASIKQASGNASGCTSIGHASIGQCIGNAQASASIEDALLCIGQASRSIIWRMHPHQAHTALH